MPKNWYFTCPLAVQRNSDLYERILECIHDHFPEITIGEEDGKLVEAKGMYASGKDWLEKWPSVRETINGGLFFTVDETSHIGKGVHTEIIDVLKKQLPVYLVTADDILYPLTALAGPEFIDGPDYTYYLYINLNMLAQRFQELSEPEDHPF